LKELIKIHRKIPIKIDLPNDESKENLFVTIENGIEKENSVLLYIKLKNSDKFHFLTKKIIDYYVKINLERQLKLFLIEKEIEIDYMN
jgi:hypothetical protein